MAAYKIPITTNQTAYPDQPEMWEHLYTAQDYWLAEELGVDSNYEVDQIVKTELELTASTGTITFASECNCFFAHMETPATVTHSVAQCADLSPLRALTPDHDT